MGGKLVLLTYTKRQCQGISMLLRCGYRHFSYPGGDPQTDVVNIDKGYSENLADFETQSSYSENIAKSGI